MLAGRLTYLTCVTAAFRLQYPLMSRDRYRFDFNNKIMRHPLYRWSLLVVSIAYIVYFIYAIRDSDILDGEYFMLIFNLGWAVSICVYAFQVARGRWGNFVEITLRHVRWSLPNQELVFARREEVLLAQVAAIDIELLRIKFTLVDGREKILPLSWLPYEVVQEVKERLSAKHATAGATSGALRSHLTSDLPSN